MRVVFSSLSSLVFKPPHLTRPAVACQKKKRASHPRKLRVLRRILTFRKKGRCRPALVLLCISPFPHFFPPPEMCWQCSWCSSPCVCPFWPFHRKTFFPFDPSLPESVWFCPGKGWEQDATAINNKFLLRSIRIDAHWLSCRTSSCVAHPYHAGLSLRRRQIVITARVL